MAACSGVQAGAGFGASTGMVQWPMAACSGVQVPAGRCMCDTGICEDPAPKGCANPTTGERCRFLYAAQGVSARDGLCFRPDGPCPDFQCRVCAYFRHGQIDVLGWLLKVPTLPTKLREKHVKGIRLNNMKTDFETVHRSMLAFLANGRLLIPLGECDNFDHRQQGCMGHGIRDDQQDARKTEILRAKGAELAESRGLVRIQLANALIAAITEAGWVRGYEIEITTTNK
jgi:hypothetical protein